MSAARQAAFEELKKEVGEFKGELGNIHQIIEKHQQKVKKFPASHKIHDEMAKLEAMSGSILKETIAADKLLDEIERTLDNKNETKRKVKELDIILDDSLKFLAGAEVLEKKINKILVRDG